MADKIKLELTKTQFRNLLDIVYAGNAMISGVNEEDEEKYNEIESIVFSKAKEAGFEGFAEFDREYDGFLPTKKFEDNGILDRMQDYDDYTFWNELAHRLALKDVAEKMSVKEPDLLFEAILDRTDEYIAFFEKHDLSKLAVKDIPPFSQKASTFRSMDIGEIDFGNKSEVEDEDECCDDECDCHEHHGHCGDDCECHHKH